MSVEATGARHVYATRLTDHFPSVGSPCLSYALFKRLMQTASRALTLKGLGW
jgi:hypothetical protein